MIQENVNQTVVSQKKPKNIWKILTVTLLSIALILSAIVVYEYSQLEGTRAEFSELSAEYDELHTDNANLHIEHSSLQHDYTALQSSYSILDNHYSTLENSYNEWVNAYENLTQVYERLENESQYLQTAFARTLKEKQIPSLSQVQSWLSLDQTNTMIYNDPDFVCTDFAAMLVINSRTKDWQMGLVFVYGNDTSTNAEYNHAFNAIITTEGLVYVEPQNDGVWWYANHAAILAGGNYEIGQYNSVTVHINEIVIVVEY